MARPDKVAAVAELTDQFRSSSAAVLTEYRGLTVAQLKELRRTLGETTTLVVTKNTLTRIAAKDAGVDAFDGMLQGPSAIAFVQGDPVEAAKGLRDFSKANPLLVIKGGVLDGKALSAADITKLADLESREVLLAKLAGAMTASLQGAVSLFAAPLAQAARVLDALRQAAVADPSILRGGAGTPATAPEPAADDAAAQVSGADDTAVDDTAAVDTPFVDTAVDDTAAGDADVADPPAEAPIDGDASATGEAAAAETGAAETGADAPVASEEAADEATAEVTPA